LRKSNHVFAFGNRASTLHQMPIPYGAHGPHGNVPLERDMDHNWACALL
jgi:hypothetical protein